jgi:RNA polymerase sigma-70 factor (ECF subfamily)
MIAGVQSSDKTPPKPTLAEDLALAERAAQGDEEALSKLYEAYADLLFAHILHQLENSPAAAEEIWQDTLSAAVRALAQFQGQSQFFSWLCGIARHKIADYWRRQGREHKRMCVLSPEEINELLDSQAVELLGQQTTQLRVVETLGQLPEEYRTALVLRYADGQPVDQVALALGKSYKAAESTLSRAREAFRQLVSRQTEGNR